jgi:thiamine pyrophosphate-dependent acetolactate synthase large subunit-like protein
MSGKERRSGFRTAKVASQLTTARARTVPAADEKRTDSYLHPMKAMWELSDIATDDTYFVIGTGHFWAFPLQGIAALRPDNYIVEDDYGAIGQALGMAIGAAVAHPTRRIVCVEGDGSLLQHLQELETIARHDLNIAVVVLNDGAYGAEVHKLNAKGMDGKVVVFGYTNFAGVAEALGLRAATVNSQALLGDTLRDLVVKDGAALVDLQVPSDVLSRPYRRLFLGEVE